MGAKTENFFVMEGVKVWHFFVSILFCFLFRGFITGGVFFCRKPPPPHFFIEESQLFLSGAVKPGWVFFPFFFFQIAKGGEGKKKTSSLS